MISITGKETKVVQNSFHFAREIERLSTHIEKGFFVQYENTAIQKQKITSVKEVLWLDNSSRDH